MSDQAELDAMYAELLTAMDAVSFARRWWRISTVVGDVDPMDPCTGIGLVVVALYAR